MIKLCASVTIKSIKQIVKVQNDVIFIVKKMGQLVVTYLLIMLREYLSFTVMQIIGYELDTAMNIEYFRPKLMKESLIL